MAPSNDELRGNSMTFQVGDKVVFDNSFSDDKKWGRAFKWYGEVVSVDCDNPPYNVSVKFKQGTENLFTADGKYWMHDSKPSLFKIQEELKMSEPNTDDYAQILLNCILGSEKYNGHGQSQLAISAKTNLPLLVSLADLLEKHLNTTEGFLGCVYIQVFSDYSWLIYSNDSDQPKVLVSCLEG